MASAVRNSFPFSDVSLENWRPQIGLVHKTGPGPITVQFSIQKTVKIK